MAFAQVSIGDPVVVQPGDLHRPRPGRDRRDGRDRLRRDDRPVGDDRPARRRLPGARRSSATSASGPAPRSSARCGSARARRSAPTRSSSTTSRRARPSSAFPLGYREPMWRFRRKDGGDTATVELPARGGASTGKAPRPSCGRRSTGSTAANREQRDRETERRLLRLRHLAGLRALEEAGGSAEFAAPDAAALPAAGGAAGVRARADSAPGLLRAGHPARRLRARPRSASTATRRCGFAERIERAFAERERHDAGEPAGRRLLRGVRAEPALQRRARARLDQGRRRRARRRLAGRSPSRCSSCSAPPTSRRSWTATSASRA